VYTTLISSFFFNSKVIKSFWFWNFNINQNIETLRYINFFLLLPKSKFIHKWITKIFFNCSSQSSSTAWKRRLWTSSKPCSSGKPPSATPDLCALLWRHNHRPWSCCWWRRSSGRTCSPSSGRNRAGSSRRWQSRRWPGRKPRTKLRKQARQGWDWPRKVEAGRWEDRLQTAARRN